MVELSDNFNPSDALELAQLALPPIQRLARLMAKGDHHDPADARKTKRSLDALLDTIEVVCARRRISFPEVLAYLHPVEDLLIALSLAAGEGIKAAHKTKGGA